MDLNELRPEHLIFPDWPAPAAVRAVSATRRGGISPPPYDGLNPVSYTHLDVYKRQAVDGVRA